MWWLAEWLQPAFDYYFLLGPAGVVGWQSGKRTRASKIYICHAWSAATLLGSDTRGDSDTIPTSLDRSPQQHIHPGDNSTSKTCMRHIHCCLSVTRRLNWSLCRITGCSRWMMATLDGHEIWNYDPGQQVLQSRAKSKMPLSWYQLLSTAINHGISQMSVCPSFLPGEDVDLLPETG